MNSKKLCKAGENLQDAGSLTVLKGAQTTQRKYFLFLSLFRHQRKPRDRKEKDAKKRQWPVEMKNRRCEHAQGCV